jgi:hypothetical protein
VGLSTRLGTTSGRYALHPAKLVAFIGPDEEIAVGPLPRIVDPSPSVVQTLFPHHSAASTTTRRRYLCISKPTKRLPFHGGCLLPAQKIMRAARSMGPKVNGLLGSVLVRQAGAEM